MALGIYLDNLDNYDDVGEHLEKVVVGGEFSPNFKSRNTIQLWKVTGDVNVVRWEGSSLAEETTHEITIVNSSGKNVTITFDGTYDLLDQDDNVVVIGPNNGTAYFFATRYTPESNVITLGMRTGSQDRRNL